MLLVNVVSFADIMDIMIKRSCRLPNVIFSGILKGLLQNESLQILFSFNKIRVKLCKAFLAFSLDFSESIYHLF